MIVVYLLLVAELAPIPPDGFLAITPTTAYFSEWTSGADDVVALAAIKHHTYRKEVFDSDWTFGCATNPYLQQRYIVIS
jgi:hypothetical protein